MEDENATIRRSGGTTCYAALGKPYFDDGCGVMVYHGDCRELMPALPDSCVDMIVTDPPYYVPVNSYVGKRGQGYHRKFIGDAAMLEMSFELMFRHYLVRVMKDTGTYYVFCDSQSYPLIWRAMYPVVKTVRCLVWDKMVSFNGYTWRRQHELIAWGELPEAVRVETGDGDVIAHRAVKVDDREHPAEKPVELIAKLIRKHETKLILDPFGGGGTTAIACQRLGRPCIMFEIEEKYCEAAAVALQGGPMFAA